MREEGLWLHVDAAYGGAAAILPEERQAFRGWEDADSIVVNAHKWLFTPLDASLFLCRRLELARAAFSLNPEYLRTLDRSSPVRDYNEFQPQLGRRFRALKLWMLVRWFEWDSGGGCSATLSSAGVRVVGGRRAGLGAHGTRPVLDCLLRHRPPSLSATTRRSTPNAAIMAAVNRTGESFLSHTRLNGRFAIRLSVGNLRTEERHVERASQLLRTAAREVGRRARRSRSSTSTERSGVPTTSSSSFS